MKLNALAVLLVFSLRIAAQEPTEKTNPIIFIEGMFGGGGGEFSGFVLAATANYQTGKNLFTARVAEHRATNYTEFALGMAGLPIFTPRMRNTEYALLYGRRYTKNSVSYSFAGGFSHSMLDTKFRDDDGVARIRTESYQGFGYEFNIKWFKADKERYRLYMLIPVGKPTAFGRSFGIKLMGNISEHSYFGLGLTYGLGWHKYY